MKIADKKANQFKYLVDSKNAAANQKKFIHKINNSI